MPASRKFIRQHVLERHLARLDRSLQRMARENDRFSWIRLGIFVLGVIFIYGALQFLRPLAGQITGVFFLALFIFVVSLHRRLDRARIRFQTARDIISGQLARMKLDWANIPATEPARDRQHPFASDLDLVGSRSVHALVNNASSSGGAARLRSWLLAPCPQRETILARQEILREIIPLAGFRSRITLNSALVTKSSEPWDGEKLADWLQDNPATASLRGGLLFLGGLAFFNLVLLLLNTSGALPPIWPAGILVYFAIYLTRHNALKDLFDEALTISQTLQQFRGISRLLENYPCPAGGRLAALLAPFSIPEKKPSATLRAVDWVASAASLQGNPFIWLPLNLLVPWDLFFAYQLERQKKHLREQLPQWLDTWYELEALNAFANFAYLNPDMTFPIVQRKPSPAGGAMLEARAIGHPLIPDHERVCNDFVLHQPGEIAVISGSNMSGKSTFLRTLGVNLALAYAGGPVTAASLQIVPMRLFTCIEVSDSLTNGISYFYAEVKRLKALLEALFQEAQMPLFFLIDEIFRGTNNQERRTGSKAYVRALAGGNGVGLISTHDLELTQLAERIPGVSNYHFKEDVKDGRMIFDFRLRRGPSPTTNALKIMALEGLPIEQPAS